MRGGGGYVAATVLLGVAMLAGCSLLLDTQELAHSEVDAGPMSDASAACRPPAFFCDDFETGDLRAWSLKLVVGAGVADVATDPVHRGTYALGLKKKGDALAKTSVAAVRLDHAPLTAGTYAARAWMLLPEKLQDGTLLMALRASTDAGASELRLLYGTGGRLYVSTRNSAGTIPAQHFSTAPFPIGAWACVEWIVSLGPSGGHKLRINNETVVDAPEATFDPSSPPYEQTVVGLLSDTDTFADLNLHIDDVVLSTEPIGCD